MIDAIYHYFLSSNMRGGEKIKGIKCNSKKVKFLKVLFNFLWIPSWKKTKADRGNSWFRTLGQ